MEQRGPKKFRRPLLAIFRANHRLVGGSGRRSAELAPRIAGRLRARAVLGAGVEKHSFLVKDHKFIAPLRCNKYGGNAHLIRRSADAVKDSEIRVFECYECGRQIERIVGGEDRIP